MPTLTDMIGQTVALGEPFIKLIADYEYTGQYESSLVSEKVLRWCADKCLKELDRKEEIRSIRRRFAKEYGWYILRKLFLFMLELRLERVQKGIKNGCNAEDVLDALEGLEVVLLMFETQRVNAEPNGYQIQLTIRENKQVAFYMEQGGNMCGVVGTA